MFLYVIRRQHVYASPSKNFTSDAILKTTDTVRGVDKATKNQDNNNNKKVIVKVRNCAGGGIGRLSS